jgi:sterol desaturase/sphingolipid hydroxylase (fatty acid hydroxylase superfamily)
MTVIQAAIPLFFLALIAELIWTHKRGQRFSRLNDSIADVSCGVLSQLAGIFDKALTLGVYVWVAAHASVQQWLPRIPAWPDRSAFVSGAGALGFAIDAPALFSWGVTFFLVDLCFYWSHRMAHEVNLLWAGHVVHHQSEEYNLAVAIRQATIGKLFTWMFYIPLALIGVPVRLFVACYGINLIYQFVLHTRAVGKLGAPIEGVMNTPSHHRVHHGVNPKYQDRNYAGVFIVFDKWFGTFEVEDEAEPVVYGVTKPLESWNPVTANLQVFRYLWQDLKQVSRWSDRVRLVFGRPGWRPAELGGPIMPAAVSVHSVEKFDPSVPRPLAGYGVLHFVVAISAALLLLRNASTLPKQETAAMAFLVVVSLVGVAGIFERAKWTWPLETARLIAFGVIGGALVVTQSPLAIWGLGGIILSVGSFVVLWRYRAAFTEVALSPVM